MNLPSLSRRSAFTLIELSIVLVVIGLLVGSILAGQGLIRTTQLRATSAELDRYRTSVHTFEEKYDALPGDMPNATKFWGAADPDFDTCASISSATSVVTCNGDGSGFIADGATPGDNRNQWYEGYRAWQHLANAGMIEGDFAGTSFALRTDNLNRPGVNVPRSRLGDTAFWGFRSNVTALDSGGSSDWFAMPAASFMTLGNDTLVGEGSGPVMTPEEAWSIDTKLDDGAPGTGFIRTFKAGGNNNPNCADGTTTDAQYAMSYTGVACAFNILLQQR